MGGTLVSHLIKVVPAGTQHQKCFVTFLHMYGGPSWQGHPAANKSGKQWCTVGSIEFTRILSFLAYESNIRFNAYHSAPYVTLPSSLTLPAVGTEQGQTKRTTNQRARSHHVASRVQNILKRNVCGITSALPGHGKQWCTVVRIEPNIAFICKKA